MKKSILTLVMFLGLIACATSCDSGITNPRQDANKLIQQYKSCKSPEDYGAWYDKFEKMSKKYQQDRSQQQYRDFTLYTMDGIRGF